MKTVLLIIKEAFSLVCLKMVVRARSLLRDTLSRNAKYHGGFRNNDGTHPDVTLFADTYTKVQLKRKTKIFHISHTLCNFQYITGVMPVYQLFHPITEITSKPQGRIVDVVKDLNNVQSCIEDLYEIRQNIDKEISLIY